MPSGSIDVHRTRASLLELVRLIPEGRVSDIGELASALHIPTQQAADILATLTADELDLTPWHRVVPPSGRLTIAAFKPVSAREQINRLVAEGHASMGPDHLWIAKRAFWEPPHAQAQTPWTKKH